VAVKGWGLHRGGKPCCCRVDFRGGAKYPEVGQAALVRKEKPERRETGLDGQNVCGGTREAIGSPSLDLVPEGGELPNHVDGGQKRVRAAAEDREEERGGQLVAKEGRKADPRGG